MVDADLALLMDSQSKKAKGEYNCRKYYFEDLLNRKTDSASIVRADASYQIILSSTPYR